MSRIRFKGTASVNIPTPPSGKASLYFDDSDNSLKIKLDTGIVVALGVSEQYIQEISTRLLIDSSSLTVLRDSSGNITSIELAPNLINDFYVDKISPTKIIDATNGRFQASVITNNHLPQSIFSIDCSMDGTWIVELKITSKRIGGLAGNPGDGATFIRTFRVKSIGSSVTIHDLQSDYTSKDNHQMNVDISVSSTNILIAVIGVANNNLKWNADIITSINI